MSISTVRQQQEPSVASSLLWFFAGLVLAFPMPWFLLPRIRRAPIILSGLLFVTLLGLTLALGQVIRAFQQYPGNYPVGALLVAVPLSLFIPLVPVAVLTIAGASRTDPFHSTLLAGLRRGSLLGASTTIWFLSIAPLWQGVEGWSLGKLGGLLCGYAAIAGALSAARLADRADADVRSDPLWPRCTSCGYSLRGLVLSLDIQAQAPPHSVEDLLRSVGDHTQCPECGESVQLSLLAGSPPSAFERRYGRGNPETLPFASLARRLRAGRLLWGRSHLLNCILWMFGSIAAGAVIASNIESLAGSAVPSIDFLDPAVFIGSVLSIAGTSVVFLLTGWILSARSKRNVAWLSREVGSLLLVFVAGAGFLLSWAAPMSTWEPPPTPVGYSSLPRMNQDVRAFLPPLFAVGIAFFVVHLCSVSVALHLERRLAMRIADAVAGSEPSDIGDKGA
jgi:hypothetical protein